MAITMPTPEASPKAVTIVRPRRRRSSFETNNKDGMGQMMRHPQPAGPSPTL